MQTKKPQRGDSISIGQRPMKHSQQHTSIINFLIIPNNANKKAPKGR